MRWCPMLPYDFILGCVPIMLVGYGVLLADENTLFKVELVAVLLRDEKAKEVPRFTILILSWCEIEEVIS